MNRARKVFISYAWEANDGGEHSKRVLAFAHLLSQHEVEVELDQFVPGKVPVHEWPAWCMNKARNAEKVLIIATKTYLTYWNELLQGDYQHEQGLIDLPAPGALIGGSRQSDPPRGRGVKCEVREFLRRIYQGLGDPQEHGFLMPVILKEECRSLTGAHADLGYGSIFHAHTQFTDILEWISVDYHGTKLWIDQLAAELHEVLDGRSPGRAINRSVALDLVASLPLCDEAIVRDSLYKAGEISLDRILSGKELGDATFSPLLGVVKWCATRRVTVEDKVHPRLLRFLAALKSRLNGQGCLELTRWCASFNFNVDDPTLVQNRSHPPAQVDFPEHTIVTVELRTSSTDQGLLARLVVWEGDKQSSPFGGGVPLQDNETLPYELYKKVCEAVRSWTRRDLVIELVAEPDMLARHVELQRLNSRSEDYLAAKWPVLLRFRRPPLPTPGVEMEEELSLDPRERSDQAWMGIMIPHQHAKWDLFVQKFGQTGSSFIYDPARCETEDLTKALHPRNKNALTFVALENALPANGSRMELLGRMAGAFLPAALLAPAMVTPSHLRFADGEYDAALELARDKPPEKWAQLIQEKRDDALFQSDYFADRGETSYWHQIALFWENPNREIKAIRPIRISPRA